jgi:hypothetical protein
MVKEALINPELRQTPGLAPAPHFLYRGQASGTRVVNMLGQVAPVSAGDGELELRIIPVEQLFQVEAGAKAIWNSKTGNTVGLEVASKYRLDPVSFAKVNTHEWVR